MNPIANPETIPMTTTRIVKKLRSRVIVENVYEANKGTGAGGSNTNLFGKKFEFKTDNEKRLLSHGFVKKHLSAKKQDYYLTKTFEDRVVVFVLQNGLKSYVKNKYNIELFRCPDEAYIIEYKNGQKVIKILEKKEQHVEGSVETKLWSCPSLKEEYEIVLGPGFEVSYGLCLNNFLKSKMTSISKKYVILNTILNRHNIKIMFGDDPTYFEQLDNWIEPKHEVIESKPEVIESKPEVIESKLEVIETKVEVIETKEDEVKPEVIESKEEPKLEITETKEEPKLEVIETKEEPKLEVKLEVIETKEEVIKQKKNIKVIKIKKEVETCKQKEPTAYVLFCRKHREEVKNGNPQMKAVDITRELARLWKISK
jgi:hypothetical protein